jgi:hypothetical protein
MTSLRAAGPEALEKWKRHPIGGEIRPEAWGIVFDPQPGNPQVQDFAACVEATHATWLMDTGMSRGEIPPQRRARAEEAVRRMGYDFHVRAVTLPPRASGTLDLQVELVNQGVAPFYAAWSPELTLVPAASPAPRPLNRTPLDARLDGLLPGDPSRVGTARIDLGGVPPATYHVLLRVPNPLPRGNPVRFANAPQDQHLPGWLTLATVQVD